jgi:hypothetical protein
MRRALLCGALLGFAVSAWASGGSERRWLENNLLSRVQLTGSRQLGFHLHDVDGDREAFNSLTYFGQGNRRFTDTGNVTVIGSKVLGVLNFQMSFADSRFSDPENQRVSLNYKRGGFAVDAGDIQGSLLNTNPLAGFSRQLRGLSAEYKGGRFAAKALHSETRGTARTISLTGNNSLGPYYIQNGRLVSGSEKVQVDGREQALNVDYTIDYEAGSITFLNTPIAPSSTILVTYEAYDFNTRAGTIQGASTSYDMGRYGAIGISAMRQKSGGTGALSTRTEQFQGFGAPSTPYFLLSVPISSLQFPTVIRVDGIRQTENVDYLFDANNPAVFYFRRFIPTTSLVEVIYYPKPTSVGDGEREVVGIDYKIPVGRGGYVQYAQATGRLKSDANPLAGTARSVSTVLRSGGLVARASLRDVPDEFVGIETRGFLRNERSGRIDLEYRKGGMLYDARFNTGTIGSRTVDGNGNFVFTSAKQQETRLGVNFEQERNTWRAEANRQESRRTGYESKLDTVSFSQSRRFGKGPAASSRWETRLFAEQQRGSLFDNSGNRNLNRTSAGMDLRYRASKEWTLAMRNSLSRTKFGSESGSGRDLQFDANYQKGERLNVQLSYIDSDAGSLTTLGGFEGFGFGYGGNGFSAGVGTSQLAGGANEKSWRLQSSYLANDRLSLNARLQQVEYNGNAASNTQTRLFSLGMDWRAPANHQVSLNLNRTDTRFLGTPLKSNATYMDLGITGRPAGRLSYRVGANLLLTGGGDFAQNSIFGDLNLNYSLDDRQNVGFRGSFGRTSGYLPQDDRMLSLYYEYRIWRNVGLMASYKLRTLTNLDPFASGGGGYRSRGLDLELTFNFGN